MIIIQPIVMDVVAIALLRMDSFALCLLEPLGHPNASIFLQPQSLISMLKELLARIKASFTLSSFPSA
jgi:hypothetical protein